MEKYDFCAGIPALVDLCEKAHDLHVVSFQSDMSLRSFLASSLSYMPGWMRFLYRVRKRFVALLGIDQDGIPETEGIRPQDVSFTPGEAASFFTVVAAQEERFWLALAQDDIITGYLAVVVEEHERCHRRFHFMTGAVWQGWKGRVYYNAILPFHHLVVRCMLRNALMQNSSTVADVQ